MLLTLAIVAFGLYALTRPDEQAPQLPPGNVPMPDIGINPQVTPATEVTVPAPVAPVLDVPQLMEPTIVENLINTNAEILTNTVLPTSSVTAAEMFGSNAGATIPSYMKQEVEEGRGGYDPSALAGYVFSGIYDASVLDHYSKWNAYWMRKRMNPKDTLNFSPGLYDYYHGDVEKAIRWVNDVLFNYQKFANWSWDYYYTHA